jgi:hypothetical protein
MKLSEIQEKYAEKIELFKRISTINDTNLNDEIRQSSALIFKVGLEKTNAEFMMNNAEHLLKLTEARIEKVIRSDGTEKKTESLIKSAVTRNPKVIKAKEDYLSKQYYFNLCVTAYKAVLERSQQISNLCYNYRKELEHNNKHEVKQQQVIKKMRRSQSEKKKV